MEINQNQIAGFVGIIIFVLSIILIAVNIDNDSKVANVSSKEIEAKYVDMSVCLKLGIETFEERIKTSDHSTRDIAMRFFNEYINLANETDVLLAKSNQSLKKNYSQYYNHLSELVDKYYEASRHFAIKCEANNINKDGL